LANVGPTTALTEPTVIVFAACVDAFDRYLERLVTVIGPECQWSSEAEFCEYTGCSPQHLEHWLSHDWVQHFPNLVLSLEDIPGPVPWVLYRSLGREQSVRVFSASEDLAASLGQSGRVRSHVQ
jgi:hypothetical protein